MEKILSIEEVENIEKPGSKEKNYCSYDGFKITTDKQEIYLLIDNGQSCCEDWGYFISNDNSEEFIGAELLSMALVDTCLNVKKAPDVSDDGGDAMFVNIETDRGTLQFTAYNDHNGYYGHEAVVLSRQLHEERYL